VRRAEHDVSHNRLCDHNAQIGCATTMHHNRSCDHNAPQSVMQPQRTTIGHATTTHHNRSCDHNAPQSLQQASASVPPPPPVAHLLPEPAGQCVPHQQLRPAEVRWRGGPHTPTAAAVRPALLPPRLLLLRHGGQDALPPLLSPQLPGRQLLRAGAVDLELLQDEGRRRPPGEFIGCAILGVTGFTGVGMVAAGALRKGRLACCMQPSMAEASLQACAAAPQ
jgi:hypothetical protein